MPPGLTDEDTDALGDDLRAWLAQVIAVLATEQARIRSERAQVARWATAASRDTEEITEALEEALQLLDNRSFGWAVCLRSPLLRW